MSENIQPKEIHLPSEQLRQLNESATQLAYRVYKDVYLKCNTDYIRWGACLYYLRKYGREKASAEILAEAEEKLRKAAKELATTRNHLEVLQQGLEPHFISSRGNEYFCEIDEEYLTDRFNLTGLNTEVHYYQHALDLITDVFDLDCEDDMRETIEKSARHLYGLVHARYIVTTRGLAKMVEKFKKADFGKCPRVLCDSQPLLPMGLSDNSGLKSVKLFCAKCEDIYNPKSSRHAQIDGAYFGSSFHNILFQVYPTLIPLKSRKRYEPKIFGFKVHAAAALSRWQSEQRIGQRQRLKDGGIDGNRLFVEDVEGDEEIGQAK